MTRSKPRAGFPSAPRDPQSGTRGDGRPPPTGGQGAFARSGGPHRPSTTSGHGAPAAGTGGQYRPSSTTGSPAQRDAQSGRGAGHSTGSRAHSPPRHGGENLLILPDFLEASIATGHPWIYRDHVPRGFTAPAGAWLRIRAGHEEAFALWDPESALALRIFSRRELPTAAWVRARVLEARELRSDLVPPETDAYRLLYGEGDGLPGVTVDVYGAYAVVVYYSQSLSTVASWVADALRALPELRGVHIRPSSSEDSEGKPKLTLAWGQAAPSDLVISENGLRIHADLESGQKTGLFLDQRDNRQAFGRLAANREVLNLFAYTGGFSLTAALGGARRVTSVDLAHAAMQRAQDNFRLNGIEPAQHEFVVADCYDFLREAQLRERRFGLVVCDPPSLARNRTQLSSAKRAYVRLNHLGLSVVEHGGYYAAASCTAQVSPDLFRELISEAAQRAGKRFQLISDVGHAADHPIQMGHREGRYLKFMLGRVLDLA